MDLIDEDWNSKEATAAALVIAVTALVAAVVAVGAAIVTAVGFAAIVTAVVVAAVALDSKPMRFPGACLHYRRRMRT
jgi:predicted RND superfamily exporter protein